MTARAHVTWLATSALVAALAGACDDVPFAAVELLLRQPEGVGDRTRDDGCSGRESVCLQLSRSVDGGASEGVSLSNDFRGPTEALPLGQQERVLDLEVFTGDPTAPDLLGRAEPALIPKIDTQGTEVAFVRPVLLAAFNEVEPLALSMPTALGRSAVCDDEAGNAWFLGAESYRFPVSTLLPEGIGNFPVGAADHLACAGRVELPEDVDDLRQLREPTDGEYYAFVGHCDDVGGDLRTGTDTTFESRVVAFGDGCDPLLAVRGTVLWLVQRDVVSVHVRESLNLIESSAIFSPLPVPRIDAIVLADGTLLVADENGGTTRYSVIDGGGIRAETKEAIGVARFILHDGEAFALTNDHRLVKVDTASPWQADEVSLPTLSTTLDAAMLRDGTVVALGPEGVAIEGASNVVPQLAGHDRTALTTTAGGALLLWGGVAGVDVLVPGAPELLSTR